VIFSDLRARALAARLDIDVDEIGICQACLSFVSFAIESGDACEIRRWTREVTPWLWDEGLALPLQASLERARRDGVPDAEAAIRDLVLNGSDGATARGVVQRLAVDLMERTRERMRAQGLLPPPVALVPDGDEEQVAPAHDGVVLMRIDVPDRRCRGSPDEVA
jgi:hypothetical protein